MRPSLRKPLAVLAALSASGVALLVAAMSQGPASSTAGPAYSVLQMNLCLSGQAGCYDSDELTAALGEAADQISVQDPSAVTLNEVCRTDAAGLARRAGYHLAFAAVDYGGAPLPCIDPRGRGEFGIAVLTRDAITGSRDHAFGVQGDPEERRWLCAITEGDVTVCTAHLSTRDTGAERAANDAGCRELRSVLERHVLASRTFFGGDVNRQSPCAPASMWVTRDDDASQAAGVQHVYGSGAPARPTVSVTDASYADHDFLLATVR